VGTARAFEPAKLICGALFAGDDAFRRARDRMAERFGTTDAESDDLPFDFTDYYAAEMGTGLRRRFFSFARLVDPGQLVEAKLLSNAVEREMAMDRDGRTCRRVNLDPGYVTLGKLVLATTKDHAHRIALRDGIFAEVTLAYRGGRWEPFPWTYPDYRSGRYDAFLLSARESLRAGARSCAAVS
jgi:hypothetical protein